VKGRWRWGNRQLGGRVKSNVTSDISAPLQTTSCLFLLSLVCDFSTSVHFFTTSVPHRAVHVSPVTNFLFNWISNQPPFFWDVTPNRWESFSRYFTKTVDNIFRVKQYKSSAWNALTWRWGHYDPLKSREPLKQWHPATSQNTWNG